MFYDASEVAGCRQVVPDLEAQLSQLKAADRIHQTISRTQKGVTKNTQSMSLDCWRKPKYQLHKDQGLGSLPTLFTHKPL